MTPAAAESARTVLYVHSSGRRYGADRQLAQLVRGLDPARYRGVVVLPEDGALGAELRSAGVPVHVRPALAVLRRGLFTPRGLAGIAARTAVDAVVLGRLIRRTGAALVHSNTSVTLGGAAAAGAVGRPHIWHAREIYADFARWWPIYRRVLLTADAVPCLSEATRREFGGAERALVIAEGLPAEALDRRPADRAQARAALELSSEAFVCLVLGRLTTWKGQEVLSRALAEPPMRDIAAIGLVAGEAWPGEERHVRDLERLRDELGLGNRLRLLGWRDDLDVLYGAADVVCVPSTLPEPLGLVALEAAAASKCVVASDTGGLPEILTDMETGRLVAPGDAGALASVLAELAADPRARERLGAAAAVDVRRRFSSTRLLEATQALYDRVLAQR
ncbi:MAG: glycosyltransferase family 4 protein [Actinomycetota bacterium]|nr:glycosyltransferase family 4 protein [Actinomycetota bacterium]